MAIERGRKLSGNFYDSKQHQDFEVFCDTGDSKHGCHGCKDFENLRWHEMIAALKEEGWTITKNNQTGEWKHRCPACVKAKKKTFIEAYGGKVT